MGKIYRLSHPTSSKIYIGKTINSLQKRLWGHIYEAKNDKKNIRKNIWIKHLLKRGFKPNIELVEDVSDKEIDDRERYHISLGWKNEPENMMNSPLMLGGEGFSKGKNLSPESRRKSSLGKRKFTNNQLKEIASRINNGEYLKDIAKEHGVHKVTLIRNLNGRVTGTSKIRYSNVGARGSRHGVSKINQEIAGKIREEYSTGNFSQKNLAEKFGLAQASVWSILKNKTWKTKE